MQVFYFILFYLYGGLKKGKKDKLSCVKLVICPDHPRRHRPLKFCMRGRVREVVIYFKFHENRCRGLGAVGGSKIALSHWQGPCTSLVQALICNVVGGITPSQSSGKSSGAWILWQVDGTCFSRNVSPFLWCATHQPEVITLCTRKMDDTEENIGVPWRHNNSIELTMYSM